MNVFEKVMPELKQD